DALRTVAERSGKRIVLIQAGQAFNEAGARAISDATAGHCAGVRAIFADGADPELYAAAFAGADIFLSLSDNIQETFGITPLEAMASGLPVIVSDWNGYRDTVRDGVDGFRIASRAPQPGGGQSIAQTYQLDQDYELYTARASATVSMDMAQLVARLTELTENPALRRQMGEAGRARAVADYDWAVVYRRYRDLWDDLAARRRHALADPAQAAWLAGAPKAHPAHEDPTRIFAHYPTRPIGPDSIVRTAPGVTLAHYERLVGEPMFQLSRMPADIIGPLLEAASGPVPVAMLAKLLKSDEAAMIDMVARLAKMNLLIIEG
ncbi:MAG: glycosyltransferase, partial [Sphingomonadales bacterium]